ncbi:hypothetical protein AAMO2058_001457400 [Amorphochlora amoebiformis]
MFFFRIDISEGERYIIVEDIHIHIYINIYAHISSKICLFFRFDISEGERYIIVEDPHESREVITLFPSSQKTLKPGSRIKRYFSVRQDYLHTERERVPVAIRTVPKVKQLDIKPVTFKPIGYVAPKDFNSESKKKSAKRKSKIHRGSKSASSGTSKKRRKR